MSVATRNLEIIQGATFTAAWNWYGGGKVCRLIGNLTPGCPTLISLTGHGLPTASNTPVFISHVKGATRANTKDDTPVLATWVDLNTFFIDMDTVAQTYTSNTGLLTYFAPKDLTGWTARMQIRESIDDVTEILELLSPTDIAITVNDAKIAVTISAAVTTALDFDEAVYDLELIDVAGAVTRFAEGLVTLRKEVTR